MMAIPGRYFDDKSWMLFDFEDGFGQILETFLGRLEGTSLGGRWTLKMEWSNP